MLTPDEKLEAIRRLLAMQKVIRNIADYAEGVSTRAKDAVATGLAFAVLMVRESILAYGKELTKWTTKLVEPDLDE